MPKLRSKRRLFTDSDLKKNGYREAKTFSGRKLRCLSFAFAYLHIYK